MSPTPSPRRPETPPPPTAALACLPLVLAARAEPSRQAAAAQGRERVAPSPAAKDDDPLDPLRRHRASLASPDLLALPSAVAISDPLASAPATGAAASSLRAAASLEDLVPALVRRIAWSGDRHRGSVRVELGAGELAGATLLVHAEGGRVRVHLDVPPGVDAGRWQRRICRRLTSRGVATDDVEVT
jgi:hypothetical protein